MIGVVYFGAGTMHLHPQFVAHISARVRLVAVEAFAVLIGPLGIQILLGALGLRPILGDLAPIQRGLFVLRKVLHRCMDNGRIDQLSIARQIAGHRQLLVNRRHDHFHQALLIGPDRLGIGNPTRRLQPEKVLEGDLVQRLVLELVIGQVIGLLENQQIDYQQHRKQRSTALGVVHFRQQLAIATKSTAASSTANGFPM